jgi:hypothetical protein
LIGGGNDLAKYKTLPNYELIRPGIHILFDMEGEYETDDKDKQDFLDKLEPFIERIDKPEKPAKPKSVSKK